MPWRRYITTSQQFALRAWCPWQRARHTYNLPIEGACEGAGRADAHPWESSVRRANGETRVFLLRIKVSGTRAGESPVERANQRVPEVEEALHGAIWETGEPARQLGAVKATTETSMEGARRHADRFKKQLLGWRSCWAGDGRRPCRARAGPRCNKWGWCVGRGRRSVGGCGCKRARPSAGVGGARRRGEGAVEGAAVVTGH